MRRILLSFVLSLSLAAALRGGDDRLCVQTHYGHENWEPLGTIEQIRDLGVGWIRDDLYWSSVEKEKGKYQIPDYAWTWLKAAKANGLKVILILNGDNAKCYEDPFDQEGYVNFVRFVAREAQGYADALELVNEPFNHYRRKVPGRTDDNSHWNGWNPATGQTDHWVEKYRRLLNAAAEAIHETTPGVYRVLGLGCSAPVNRRLLEMGISPRVDGMALHPYAYRYVPELQPYGDTPGFLARDGVVVGDAAGTTASMIEDLRDAARRFKGPSELWLTEVGYTTFIPTQSGRYGGFTDEAQAKYALRHFMEALGLEVRLTSWYAFYSRQDSPYSNLGNFGLVRFDGTPKPAYLAIQRLTAAMADYVADPWGEARVHFRPLRHHNYRPDPYPVVWDGSPRATYGTPRAYTFSSADGQKRLLALWSSERAGGDLQPRLADLRVPSDRVVTAVTAHDLYTDEKRPLKFRQKGRVLFLDNVTVPDRPVLLTLEGTAPVAEAEAIPDTPPLFAKAEGWKFSGAKNAQGAWTAADGIGTLRVERARQGFVGAEHALRLGVDTPALSLRVRSAIEATLLVRVINEAGTVRQFKRALAPSRQWEAIHVNPLRDPHQQWNADKNAPPGADADFPPAATLFLGVETPGQAGTVEFKDLLLLPE